MTTFEIYLFTQYTNIMKLYKASDGQYFVKLKDAQAYCNLLNEKTFTEIQRPANLLPMPSDPIPVNELWVKYPTLWQWRGDFSISGNVQLLPVPSAENRMWVYRITTTSATVSKELRWGNLDTQKLVVGVGDYIMCTSEKWEKLFDGNSTDANLRDRTTHTGFQAISTITDLQKNLDAKINKEVPLFVFFGESNSEGRANNSDATSVELSTRNNTMIWNVTNSRFENLRIGVNSVWNNDIQFQNNKANWHGWELEIANRTLDRIGANKVYITKCGQGGSQVQDWSSMSYTNVVEAQSRITNSINYIRNLGYTPKIYAIVSLGINDAIAGTTVSAFTPLMNSFIANIKTICGAYTPIILTGIPQVNTSYININNAISTFANNTNVFVVPVSGLAMQDTNHYSYVGMKVLANRILDICLDVVGLPNNMSGRSVTQNGWDLIGGENVPKSGVSVTRIRPIADTTAWGSSPFRVEKFSDPNKFGYMFFDAVNNRFVIGGVEAGVANLDVYIAPNGRAKAGTFVADVEFYGDLFRGGRLILQNSVNNGSDQNSALIQIGNSTSAISYGYISHDASDSTTYIGSILNGVAHKNLVLAFMSGSKLGIGRKPTTNKFESAGIGSFDDGLVVGALVLHASAVLQADSTTKGFLAPRMTTTQINAISNPAEGLEVYNTTLKTKCFFNGSSWQKVTSTAM